MQGDQDVRGGQGKDSSGQRAGTSPGGEAGGRAAGREQTRREAHEPAAAGRGQQGAAGAGAGSNGPSSRRPMVEYRDFVDAVTDLEFARDRNVARRAIGVVLGLLAARMSDADAARITKSLPEPLNMEQLKVQEDGIPAEDASGAVAAKLKMDGQKAAAVVAAVLKTLKRCVGEDEHKVVAAHLPDGWRALVDAP